jgi:GH15 family glucan-1,4-alpha-glucosidase
VRREEFGIRAIAGPDAVQLRTEIDLRGEDFRTHATFTVAEKQRVPLTFTWYESHEEPPEQSDPLELLEETEKFWHDWSSRCHIQGDWHELRLRSLITLKALTYSPTGGIVAAPTTSLPEAIGGVRNWDYRYCWVRDSTFILYALLSAGYTEEAAAWREWLLRAVAGEPSELQIMYGIKGERRLSEYEVSWLRGYELSSPVRVGNAAHRQFQLDVYGEIMDTFEAARHYDGPGGEDAWRVQRVLMDCLESRWQEPDDGIWEVRGPSRPFTHSKVMAWVAADRAVKAVENYKLEGDLARWKKLRATIHEDVCRKGFDSSRNSFVQYYGSHDLDASLLMIPLVGFLPAHDPRVIGTVNAIQHDLVFDGFVKRYIQQAGELDGLPGGEGVFLPCTFWLADNLALLGRRHEARKLFERLITLCNEVGLISEEYDLQKKRLIGNFPQAFTHVALVNTAQNLSVEHGPARRRAGHS